MSSKSYCISLTGASTDLKTPSGQRLSQISIIFTALSIIQFCIESQGSKNDREHLM